MYLFTLQKWDDIVHGVDVLLYFDIMDITDISLWYWYIIDV